MKCHDLAVIAGVDSHIFVGEQPIAAWGRRRKTLGDERRRHRRPVRTVARTVDAEFPLHVGLARETIRPAIAHKWDILIDHRARYPHYGSLGDVVESVSAPFSVNPPPDPLFRCHVSVGPER